jgi:hypothetical protein
LLVGIVTKGKLSAIFTELSASTETVEWRTEAEFFGVVLEHATEQQWETAWESIFAYAGYPTVVKWNGSTRWWWLLSAEFMPPDMHDLSNMSHVIESPMSTISNSCLHPSWVRYNMGVMTGCESRKGLSLISIL